MKIRDDACDCHLPQFLEHCSMRWEGALRSRSISKAWEKITIWLLKLGEYIGRLTWITADDTTMTKDSWRYCHLSHSICKPDRHDMIFAQKNYRYRVLLSVPVILLSNQILCREHKSTCLARYLNLTHSLWPCPNWASVRAASIVPARYSWTHVSLRLAASTRSFI